jgi:hypothetical protein
VARVNRRFVAMVALILFAFDVTPVVRAQDMSAASGVRELTEAARLLSVGDYEGVTRALEPLAPQLAGDPSTRPRAVQAYVLLATAQAALGQSAGARASFVAALRIDRGIRLTEKDHSPKIVIIFNEALAEFRATTKGSRTGLVVGAAGAGVVGTIVATRGDSSDSRTLSLANLRFITPVVTCPDGAEDLPLTVSLTGDLNVPGSSGVTLDTTQVTLVITSSPGFPGEVGFSSSRPASANPQAAPAGTTSVVLSTSLLCGNGVGDAPRVNEFLARVSLSTTRGLVTAETADRMRVNIP